MRSPCALPITRRALVCATRPRSGRESWSAGQTPNTIAVTTASAVLNSSTGTFISMTDSAANELVGTQATISARPFHAISTPSAAPATAIASASVNSCRTIRTRAAPSAARTASSCCRCAPRTSSRIETLAQPIEQQRRHRAEQQEEPRPHRPRVHLDDAAQVHSKRVGIARRRLGRELLQDRLQFGVGLGRSTRPGGS